MLELGQTLSSILDAADTVPVIIVPPSQPQIFDA